VALIFDYESAFMWETQPQGADFDYFRLVFETYRALRRTGLNIDVIAPDADLTGYGATFAPGLAVPRNLSTATGKLVLGPRAFAKTENFQIPMPLPPGLPGLAVSHVESLPPSLTLAVEGGGTITRWVDRLEVGDAAEIIWQITDGSPALVRSANMHYLAGWLDREGLARLIGELGLPNAQLPRGLRRRTLGDGTAVMTNYSATTESWNGRSYAPASVTFEAP
ncbi:MAG: beta-galactosidase trimerization domain-containing protein, partial [Pseudomonadota bacterium]